MSQPQPKPGILDIKPYVGGEGRVAGVDRLIRLASNENPLGCSDKARAAYLEAATELHRYPDGNVALLREAIGKKYSMHPSHIVCGAGSDELISLLIRAYVGQGDELVYSEYGFLMYPIGAKAVGAKAIAAPETDMRTDVDAMIAAVTPKTKMMIIANPNNPTGSFLTSAELERLCANVPENVVIVIDAAYAEFVNDPQYEDGRRLVDKHQNVVMLRTFSKIHGLAALRLGWGYFPPEMADIVNRLRGPFNVSVPAQVAGVAALADDDFIRRTIQITNDGRDYLTQELTAMGYKVYPSVGNFILVRFGESAEDIRLMLKNQGIFVRQMGAYNLPDCLRITIGLPEDNQALVGTLKSRMAA